MKKMTTVLFAAAIALSACGSSSDDAEAATDLTSEQESSDGAEAKPEPTTDDDSAEPTDNDAADNNDADDNAADNNDAGDDTGEVSDLDDDGLALATALTDAQMVDADNPFTQDEIQCVNEGLVRSIGLEQMNGYGITVENPDDTLLPDEFDVQQKAIMSITDCVSIGETFRALAPPGCDIPLSDEEMEMAMTHDFLGAFSEYDNAEAAQASADMEAAMAACG